jgi:peptidyl-prolyl cis-trans isomerase B (cyclophilin B)
MSSEEKRMLYSLHISAISAGKVGLNNLSPLEILTEDKLNRSKLFTEGFYPLNSIINVIIYSEEKLQIKGTNSEIIGSLGNANELQKNGWYFISNKPASTDEINKLDLRYLFGKTNSVDKQELMLRIGPIVEDVTIIDTPQNDTTQNGGGCLIATAAFGSEMAPQVQFLRELRDNTVLQTESGTSFMAGFNQFYYSFSPYIADYERENPAFKETVKLTLTPLLTSLTLLQYADIDSESEMLGYGIGVMLLNIGMYFVAPAVLIVKIKKLI